MSLFLRIFLVVGVIAAAVVGPDASAQSCVHGEEAELAVTVYVVDRIPYVGDASVEYVVTPFPVIDDGSGDGSGDGEIEEPTPVVASVPVGSRSLLTLPAGQGAFTVTVPGFESAQVQRSLCGKASFTVTLMPSTASVLEVFVAAADNRLSAEGAVATLVGTGPRASERFSETVSGGSVVFDGVPAGLYSLVIEAPGEITQRVALAEIDLLDDAIVSVKLHASDDLPKTQMTCASVGALPLGWLGLLTMLSLFWRRRR